MQRWRRLLLITAVVAALAVLFHLIHVHGLEPIRAQVEQLGVWAPLGIVVLRGISILLPALPSTAYSLLAGRCWASSRLHHDRALRPDLLPGSIPARTV